MQCSFSFACCALLFLCVTQQLAQEAEVKAITFMASITLPVLVAACAPTRYGDNFQALDTNKDGYITTEEAQARSDLVVNWSRIDKDNDAQLNQAEFSAFERAKGVAPPGGRYRGYRPRP